MVLPVTGPIHGAIYTPGVRNTSWSRYRQTMPIDRPLPYWKSDRRIQEALSALNYGNCWNWKQQAGDTAYTGLLGYWDVISAGDVGSRQEYVLALNGAMEAFRGEIGKQAEWMVNALQYNQALSLAANAMTKLRKFTRAVKRGDLVEARKVITPGHGGGRKDGRRDEDRGGLHAVRDVGSAWLSYSYGVKPLVQDVYNGIDIVTRTPEHIFTPKQGKRNVQIFRRGSYVYTTQTPVNWVNRGIVRGRCGGTVVITNPNAFALSSLGLTNPVAWAWEMIPFSFVVDWFVNVGDVLSSMVPDLGFKVVKPWASCRVNVNLRGDCSFTGTVLPPSDPLNNQWSRVINGMAVLGRTDSLPPVKLVAKLGVLTSLPRALNAASLLAVQLRGK